MKQITDWETICSLQNDFRLTPNKIIFTPKKIILQIIQPSYFDKMKWNLFCLFSIKFNHEQSPFTDLRKLSKQHPFTEKRSVLFEEPSFLLPDFFAKRLLINAVFVFKNPPLFFRKSLFKKSYVPGRSRDDIIIFLLNPKKIHISSVVFLAVYS